jgi:hypothetical protein
MNLIQLRRREFNARASDIRAVQAPSAAASTLSFSHSSPCALYEEVRFARKLKALTY